MEDDNNIGLWRVSKWQCGNTDILLVGFGHTYIFQLKSFHVVEFELPQCTLKPSSISDHWRVDFWNLLVVDQEEFCLTIDDLDF